MIHGCPCLPGDGRIPSGLRIESGDLVMVSLKHFLRDTIPIWRSANMAPGIDGRTLPSHIVQLIGIRPDSDQCKGDRVGQARVNE
eukprot:1246618-Pyramimonas_sp.AAC.2